MKSLNEYAADTAKNGKRHRVEIPVVIESPDGEIEKTVIAYFCLDSNDFIRDEDGMMKTEAKTQEQFAYFTSLNLFALLILMIKKKEKKFISFGEYRENRTKYNKQLMAGEIELYLLSSEFPPIKISIADVS